MKPAYILEEVHINMEDKEAGGLILPISEGDVILYKTFSFELLPAKMDFVKEITREKVTNAPQKTPERLLRIKKLTNTNATVALLKQESFIEGDTLVTKEREELITVGFGEQFHAYAKQQFRDMPGAIVYDFIIKNLSNPEGERKESFCTDCGGKHEKNDKFCPNCGAPVAK